MSSVRGVLATASAALGGALSRPRNLLPRSKPLLCAPVSTQGGGSSNSSTLDGSQAPPVNKRAKVDNAEGEEGAAAATAADSVDKVKQSGGAGKRKPWDGLLIVGLGNPGGQFDSTRHNLGFMVLDVLAKRHKLTFEKVKHTNGLSAVITINDRECHFLKPQTYVNLSGDSVSPYFRLLRQKHSNFTVGPENILVLLDDNTIPFGQIRVKPKGSSGGHNGLKSIEQKLTTKQYARMKIGIGKGDSGEMANHVLGHFTTHERMYLPQVLEKAAEAVELCIASGKDIEKAMNHINTKTGPFQVEVPY